MDSLSYYFQHYFRIPSLVTFFLLAMVILIAIVGGLYLYAVLESRRKLSLEQRKLELHREAASLIERFYELVFSGTSILFFMDIYYLVERFLGNETYRSIWERYNNFLLLMLIILSCVINSFLDQILVKLGHITKDEKASIRLTSMLYMGLIFAYIKFIYENNNYDMFITYLLGLMIGRFVYFDASLTDFIQNIKNALYNVPMMILLLGYTALLSFYGFSSDYLLIHNGVITNVFLAHVYMCICIFIVHNTIGRISRRMHKKKADRLIEQLNQKNSQEEENIE